MHGRRQIDASLVAEGVLRHSYTRVRIADLVATLGRWLIAAVLIAAPWQFGGVRFSDQVWLYSGVLGGLFLWVLSLLIRPAELRSNELVVPTLLLPLSGALFLGALQLAPNLPQRLPKVEFYRVPTTQTDDEGDQLGRLSSQIATEFSQRRQFSLYPAATRLEVVRLTTGVAAFLAAVGLWWRPRDQRWLLALIAANGAGLACFGVVQKLSWNGKLFWSVPLTMGGQPFASFVNRNNAAGYLNLCFAAAAGLLAWSLWSNATRHDDPKSLSTRLQDLRRIPLGDLIQSPTTVGVLAVVLILVGVIASVSRGGILASIVAGGASLWLLSGKIGIRKAVFAVGVLVVICGAASMWLGLGDQLSERLGEKATASARWSNWQDAWRVVRDFPVLGTGLGTYRYAYQPYEVRPVDLWFVNADNQYLEGLTEGGAVGLGLILACVVLVCYAAIRVLRSDQADGSTPLGLVALIVVITQFTQALLDFGVSMPSNMITLAVLAGVIVSAAARGSLRQSPPWGVALPVLQPTLVAVVVATVVLAIGGVGLVDVYRAGVCAAARHNLPSAFDSRSPITDERLDLRINALRAAINGRPDDAETRQALADMCILRYRRSMYQNWKQTYEASPPGQFLAPIWDATGCAMLHRYANTEYSQGNIDAIGELRNQTLVAANLVEAQGQLTAAKSACPIYPRIDSNLAMLAFLERDDPAGVDLCQRGVGLTPVDQTQLYTAGLLSLQAERPEECFAYWRRCLLIGTKHLEPILNLAIREWPVEEVVSKLIPDTPDKLVEAARKKFHGEEFGELRAGMLAHARELLESSTCSLPKADRSYWLGVAEMLEESYAAAVPHLKKAIAIAEQPERRRDLIEALRKTRSYDEAIDETRTGIMLYPRDASWETLRKELVHEKLTAR